MIELRQGNEADCDAVLAVLKESFSPYLNLLIPPSGVTKETAETLRQKVVTETLLVAEVDGRVVGCLFFTPHHAQPDTLYFGRLGVLPAFQKQGIARQLVRQVEQAATAGGFAKVGLAVRIVLPDNIHFFESMGYEIAEAKAHTGFNEPTYYTMVKQIG